MQITFNQLNTEQAEICDRYILNPDQFAFGLNSALRNNRVQGAEFEGPLAILGSIFNLVPQQENPITLFRGTVNDITINDDNTFTSLQFMSASTDEMIAARFTNTDPAIFMRIHLQCCNIKLLNMNSDINNTYEEEYLIPRNTRFRVLYRGTYTDAGILRSLGIAQFVNELQFIGICPISE